ncbi:hypothetical protein Tco_0013995 [Tanacetum coccineum]
MEKNREPEKLRYRWDHRSNNNIAQQLLRERDQELGDVCLSRSRARTISFNSETSGDTPEVEAFVLTLATMALLRELRTLDLLSMMLEHFSGPFFGEAPRIHDVDMLGRRSLIDPKPHKTTHQTLFETGVLFSSHITGCPLEEKGKSINLIDVVGTLVYLKVEVIYLKYRMWACVPLLSCPRELACSDEELATMLDLKIAASISGNNNCRSLPKYETYQLVLLWRDKTKCASCVRKTKAKSPLDFICASLESISAIEYTWERLCFLIPPPDPEEDPKGDDDEDPKEDPADYPIDGGDGGDDEDKSSDDEEDDDEDDDVDIEEDEEEEEHLAPADSIAIALPAIDLIPHLLRN